MQVPITIIIPTMNRSESLDRTLKCIFKGKYTPNQIVIIDQSQAQEKRTENQKILCKYKDCCEKRIYEYQQNPSSTKARNLGISKVENEIVVFSDDDIDVNVDTLKNVYAIMQDKEIAMIAGIDELTSSSATNIGYFLGTKSYRKRNIGHVTLSMLGRYPDNVQKRTETQWAQGYFFVVRKSLMDKWHCCWDENLTSYAYAEDLDFSFGYYKHAHAEGMKCILDPSVKVKHLATKEFRIPSSKSIYMYIINRAYLSHKHGMGFSGLLASSWCNIWRLVQNIVVRKNFKTLANAIWCSLRYYKEIKLGKLDYDKFIKSKW